MLTVHVAVETKTALVTSPRRQVAATPVAPAGVPRTRLVRSLVAATGTPIVLIVAPAGYGKTTLVSEWAARDERPFARVSLAHRHGAAEAQRLLEAATRSRAARVIAVDDAQL